jgi:hypothetical protein
MKNYLSNWSILIFILVGLSFHNALSPISIALGIMFASLNLYKNKQQINSTVYTLIIVGSLTLMIIAEYFLVPIQNTIFYLFIIMIAIGLFLTFYFYVISKEHVTSKTKILAWTGSILFTIGFFGVFGITLNNQTITLIMIVLVLIVALVSLIIRRRINKENALNEFNEINSTQRDIKKEWFKFKIGSIPKPVRWQGWVCYIILFISPFLVLTLDLNPTTSTAIIVALITIIITIAILKSNYRESAREYRENLKKQANPQASESDEVQ